MSDDQVMDRLLEMERADVSPRQIANVRARVWRRVAAGASPTPIGATGRPEHAPTMATLVPRSREQTGAIRGWWPVRRHGPTPLFELGTAAVLVLALISAVAYLDVLRGDDARGPRLTIQASAASTPASATPTPAPSNTASASMFPETLATPDDAAFHAFGVPADSYAPLMPSSIRGPKWVMQNGAEALEQKTVAWIRSPCHMMTSVR